MTTEINDTAHTRRGPLAAGIGAAAAAVAASIARVAPVGAANGDTDTVGSSTKGSGTTSFEVGANLAVRGTSTSSRGRRTAAPLVARQLPQSCPGSTR